MVVFIEYCQNCHCVVANPTLTALSNMETALNEVMTTHQIGITEDRTIRHENIIVLMKLKCFDKLQLKVDAAFQTRLHCRCQKIFKIFLEIYKNIYLNVNELWSHFMAKSLK